MYLFETSTGYLLEKIKKESASDWFLLHKYITLHGPYTVMSNSVAAFQGECEIISQLNAAGTQMYSQEREKFPRILNSTKNGKGEER